MFTTWTILFIFATTLTVISFRNINILLTLGAVIGWFSLMAFNLNNPLVGIAIGSIIHQWLTMGFVAIGLAVLLMYFRNRGRQAGVYGSRSSGRAWDGSEVVPPSASEQKSLMELTPDEYKARARKALHPRRRR